jgi:iron complex transport system substrate-binding protein
VAFPLRCIGGRGVRASWIFLLTLAACGLCARAAERVVSAGGGVTEIVYALGLEDCLVGVDTSSVYPAEASRLPQVGYARALSAEGILSLDPTLLVCYEEAGPPTTLGQIEKAGVRLLRLPSHPTPKNVELRISAVAEALGAPDRAGPLIGRLRGELADALRHQPPGRPCVLFIYARSGGILNASGTGTHADAMIRLAGGINAVHGYEGYKPLTAEAALLANPDVILVTSRGIEEAGGMDALLGHPGLADTPAARMRRVVAMDDLLLLGFGPRLGLAVGELSRLIHGGRSATAAAARTR